MVEFVIAIISLVGTGDESNKAAKALETRNTN